jgi:hypothetical protein
MYQQPLQPKKKGLFSKFSQKVPAAPITGEEVRFSVDARIPATTILTCNEPIPLKTIITKLSQYSQQLYVRFLQVRLIATTQFRAHGISGSDKKFLIIISQPELSIPIGSKGDQVGSEWALPTGLWDNIPIPDTIAPDFESCNIARSYELEVVVGICSEVDINIPRAFQMLPVTMPIRLFSGLAPPAELLRRMNENQERRDIKVPLGTPEQHAAFERMNSGVSSSSYSFPSSATVPTSPHPSLLAFDSKRDPETYAQEQAQLPQHPAFGAGSSSSAFSPQHSASSAQPANQSAITGSQVDESAPPPSYEDTVVEDIGPFDGPRRTYTNPSVSQQQQYAQGNTDKKGLVSR